MKRPKSSAGSNQYIIYPRYFACFLVTLSLLLSTLTPLVILPENGLNKSPGIPYSITENFIFGDNQPDHQEIDTLSHCENKYLRWKKTQRDVINR